METSNFSGDEKLEFRQIVLNYLRKIMDLNLKIVSSDFKIQYLQTYRDSVLGLSDVLIPFYDEQMNTIYSKYQREYEELVKQTTKNGMIINVPTYKKLSKQIHRELFRELNLLLKRNDYLKESVYGENNEEVIESDEQGGEWNY